MQDYIAAGFDPARFWDLTPRLYAAEMEGARRRIARERELVWWGAMLPYFKKPVSLEQFIGQGADKARDVAACVAAWDRFDRALMAGKGNRT